MLDAVFVEQRISLVTIGVADMGVPGCFTKRSGHRANRPKAKSPSSEPAAGSAIGRHGAATFWGGYFGVFIDPGGHTWEVAHSPGGSSNRMVPSVFSHGLKVSTVERGAPRENRPRR